MGTVLEVVEYPAGPVLGTEGGAAAEGLGRLGTGRDALAAQTVADSLYWRQPLLLHSKREIVLYVGSYSGGLSYAQGGVGSDEESRSYSWL